jgi:RES domain-containing protein
VVECNPLMRVWRICKKRYAANAFSGEGGLLAPARWHHMGVRIVYTSQSLSLAALETWVHVAPQSPLPDHVSVPLVIPDGLPIHDIPEASLPQDWKRISPPSLLVRDIGHAWLLSKVSAVARVPAVTTAGEFNYLINPLHPDFRKLEPGEAQPFQFDARMWK